MSPDPASRRPLPPGAARHQARIARRSVWVALCLATLLGLAAVLVWGPHWGRHWIASQLGASLGRVVEIDRIVHRPWRGEIEIQGVRLRATGASAVQASLDRLELKLQIPPLLSRSVQVSNLVIDRPRIALHRDGQGALDAADLWARLNADSETAHPWAWRIDRLQVLNGEARLQDDRVGSTFTLEGLTLEARALTPQGLGARADLSGRIQGAAITIRAGVTGSAQDPLSELDLQVDALDLMRLMPWVEAAQREAPLALNPRWAQLTRGQLARGEIAMVWRPRAADPARLSLQGLLNLADLDGRWGPAGDGEALGTAELRLNALQLVLGPTTPLGGQVQLNSLDLHQGQFRWRDAPTAQRPDVVLDDISLQVRDLVWPIGSTTPPEQGQLRLNALLDGQSPLQAELELMPEGITTRAQVRQWQPGPWMRALMPPSAPRITLEPLDLDGELHWAPAEARWTLSKGTLRTAGWSVQADSQVIAQARDTVVSTLQGQGRHGSVQMDAMQLAMQRVQVLDRPMIPSLTLQGQIARPDPAPDSRMPLRAQLSLGSSGQIDVDGTLRAQPVQFDGRLAFRDLDLLLMRPELEQSLRLAVERGRLWGGGQARISSGVVFDGAAALTDLRTQDRPTGQPVVALRALTVPECRLVWTPPQGSAPRTPVVPASGPPMSTLQIETGTMALVDLDARITLETDGTLNLQRILADPRPGQGGTTTHIRLGPLRIAGARIDFNDQFIQPQYRANLSQLNGTITPLLGEPDQFSDVDLRGLVDGDTPVEIIGQVRALGAEPSLDLRAVARGFDLPKLSPYSGKWAGYAIEKGSLTANVRYRLRSDQLEAENRLIIHQLTFGEPVASPTALQWPVRLAVSLLKDAQGVIDLDLPIAGSLSDPQFSVGGLIWRALGNLALKTVRAPFAALASLLRGEAAALELSQIDFAPGSAELDEAARLRLKSLAQALTERPEITLELIGQAQPETDRDALTRLGGGAQAGDDDLRDLAQRRAQSARRELRDVHGVSQDRMFMRAPRWAATDGLEPQRRVSFELR